MVKLSLGVALLLSFVAAVLAGSNEPIADNELGLTAKDCASQYCSSKDGLGLWMTLEQSCMMDPNPYLIAQVESSISTSAWSPTIVGTLSAVLGVVGMMVGFASGHKFSRNRMAAYYPVA
eukprot:FR740291.1.p2 GENE.FR740291.1~~FR740291.1.p2  ORF type:complete len:120 (+),score=5.49 FR740291.1:186-545(+)